MSIEQDILAREKEFWQSMIDRDAKAGAAMMADTSLVTGAQGVGKIDRKTFAKMMEQGAWKLHKFDFSDVQVTQVTPDVAVIAYKVREEITVDGQRLTMQAADASTWVKQDGKWVCALHTESVLGDPYGRDRVKKA
ncbi:MAG TPA: nuclear transport factor 2 family protein [Bauldia sp.]|jgi:uncharacterized protein (TIGR02246 family)|nr:nuclear transport factor 2 family protein [Bauldia sp.]